MIALLYAATLSGLRSDQITLLWRLTTKKDKKNMGEAALVTRGEMFADVLVRPGYLDSLKSVRMRITSYMKLCMQKSQSPA